MDRQIFKKFIPKQAFKVVSPYAHLAEAGLANLREGFPARRLRLIGITGTNGKTTTANLLGAILETAGYKVGISSTAIYRINGVERLNATNMTVTSAASLQKLLKEMVLAGCEWGVIEVTSHALAQFRTAGLRFEAVAMTNLTQDHLDYHGTMENYAKAKARLFKDHPLVMVLNADDPWYGYFNKFQARLKLSYGLKAGDVTASKLKLSATGSKFELEIGNVSHPASIQLPGEFNVYNALAAATIAHGLGVPLTAIVEGLEALGSVPGRMQVVHSGQYRAVVDYAHTPDALEKLLAALRPLTKGRLSIVMGATGDRDKTKRPGMGEIAARLADHVYVTDDDPYTEDAPTIRSEVIEGIVRSGRKNYSEIGDRQEAIIKAVSDLKPGDIVALTGIGHQSYRVIGKDKVAWSEATEAENALAQHK